MSLNELILRRLEDFILAEKDLLGIGSIRFTHEGEAARGYPYIRSSNQHFEQALTCALTFFDAPAESIRFLEVGSGIGTKTAMAQRLGLQATGLDYKQEYVDLARAIFPECVFHQANALDFDYSAFDLVYYHQPLATVELMHELEQLCLMQLPISSILIATRLTPTLESYLADAGNRSGLNEIPLKAGRLRGLRKLATLRF